MDIPNYKNVSQTSDHYAFRLMYKKTDEREKERCREKEIENFIVKPLNLNVFCIWVNYILNDTYKRVDEGGNQELDGQI